MKKVFFILLTLFVAALAVVTAQEVTPPDTIPVDIITGGETIVDFLKANMWYLIIVAYSGLEVWFGQTQIIKEGSFLAWVWNFLGKMIRKQIPTVKAAFMTEEQIKLVRGPSAPPKENKGGKGLKIVLLLVMFSFIGTSAQAQSRWDGFFEKKSGTKVEQLKGEGDKSFAWFVRPTAQLTAMKLEWDPEAKIFNPGQFSAAGVGLGYQHYTEHNGELINDYGVNGLLIINGSEASGEAGFGVAATVNALGFVNFGGGRDFTNDKWLLLLGASWSF